MPGAREISSNGFADAAVTEGVCLNLRMSKTESVRETVLHPHPGAHAGGISFNLCIPKQEICICLKFPSIMANA